jgi:4-carboxymuconolactone decarboxylase
MVCLRSLLGPLLVDRHWLLAERLRRLGPTVRSIVAPDITEERSMGGSARADRAGEGGGGRHGRLAWPTPDELDDARREVHASITGGPRGGEPAFALTDGDGRLHGPFNVMLAAPGPGLALSELGAALRFRTSLSDRVREVAILTLAVLHRSSFEWYAHDAVARRIGMSEAEVAALRALEPAPTFDATELAVQRCVVRLVRDGDLDDEAFAEAERALGTEGVVELVVLTGYYSLLAVAMRVLRSPLPEGVEEPFREG